MSDIKGGGGLGESLSPQNSDEMFKIWAEKKLVDGFDEKYFDQNKPANGNVQNRENIRQNLIFPYSKFVLPPSEKTLL